MNNLVNFYKTVEQFADEHNMINQFLMVGSEQDLDGVVFDYRTLVLIPSSSNISRDLSRPIYTLSFDCALIDKCSSDDQLAAITSVEENIFVIGQLQDYLIQIDENCYIDEVDITRVMEDDENITTAFFNLTVSFARKNYNVGIDNQ